MSIKKPKGLTPVGVLTGIGPGAPTPTAAFKRGEVKLTPETKTPGPTDAQLALEYRQREESAVLDKEENERRKRLLSAMQGARAFRGSALFRGNQAAQNAKSSGGRVTIPDTSALTGRMFAGGPGGSSMAIPRSRAV